MFFLDLIHVVMESPLLILVFLYFGLFCVSVDSQQDLQQSPLRPPPPPPTPSPPPPPPSPSPSPPPPPPTSPSPPPPTSPSPSPPPPARYPQPPAPPKKAPHPPSSSHTMRPKSQHKKHRPPPPPQPAKNLNFGKKLGFIFVGFAAILQICVATFLVIKRRDLIKTHDIY